jgi:large subunit ribosomal protein L4
LQLHAQGTQKAKNRGETSGSGKKPFKQKGTGRARQGSVRAPLQRGGGAAHAVRPRTYFQRTPKKMIAAALRGVLSDRQRHDRIHVLDSIATAPSTKAAIAAVRQFSDRKNLLVVVSRTEDLAWRSLRNADEYAPTRSRSVECIRHPQVAMMLSFRSCDQGFLKGSC